MSGHTKGPWKQYCHGEQVYQDGGDRCFITIVQSKNAKADARLIAAAPELLEALEYSVAQMGWMARQIEEGKGDKLEMTLGWFRRLKSCHALIEKARGQS